MIHSYIFKALANTHLISKKLMSRSLMYFYKSKFRETGNDVKFDPISSYFTYNTISLASYVFIGNRAWFSGDITIGSYVMFGPNVTIMGGDHDYQNIQKPMYFVESNPYKQAKVTIEDDVWIGTNVTILKGVTVKQGAVIAAGSIVTKDVEEYSIVAGVPAKHIKSRFKTKDQDSYIENLKSWKPENAR